jgi:hypothetical protein
LHKHEKYDVLIYGSVSNLGGTFPRIFVLKLVDYFTKATCVPPSQTSPGYSDLKNPITEPFSCALEADKHLCLEGGGTCNILRDGYYITNIICVLIGAITFWTYIRPAALRLQAMPLRAWRIGGGAERGTRS